MSHSSRWVVAVAIMAAGILRLCAAVSPTPTILSPSPNAIIADTLPVTVSVISTYEVTNVTASFGPLIAQLAYSSSGSWTNAFDTSGLARGTYGLGVVAQDIFGNTGQAQAGVRIDRPPVLNVIAPLNGTVAQTNLEIEAVASDDDPAGARILVYNNGAYLCGGTNTVHCSVPGLNGSIQVVAIDSANQQTQIQRTVNFEPSTNLVEAVVAAGPLLDFSPSKLLYSFVPDPPQPPFAQLLDRSSGAVISAPSYLINGPFGFTNEVPTQGWISDTSVVFVYAIDVPPANVFFRYAVTLYGTNFVPFSLSYSGEPDHVDNGITIVDGNVYDLNRSTNGCAVISPVEAHDFWQNVVAFITTNGVFKSVATNSADMCSRALIQVSTNSNTFKPVTDGTNVVFETSTNVVANINGTEEQLVDATTWTPSLGPVQYLANAGWIAFTRLGTTLQRQIWTRSPTGKYEQRTFFSISSSLESLNDNGTLTFTLTAAGQEARYLSMPGFQPIWINSGQGRVKWDAGTPYVIIGRSAFRISLGTLGVKQVDERTITLELNSPNGLRYLIQQSSDLFTWSDLMTITNVTGAFSFTNGLSGSAQFYRAILRP